MNKTIEMSPEKNTLILTVGLPYSGKSTWARSTRHPIVCPDSIRVALHGHRYIPETEDYVWAIVRTMIISLFLSGHEVVILDATNITKERRSRWESNKWKTVAVVFDSPLRKCVDRAKVNGDEEIIPIIERMANEMELPEMYASMIKEIEELKNESRLP